MHDSVISQEIYFYLLADGECEVIKDGKRIHAEYGVLERGSAFGENAMVFSDKDRSADIVASKSSSSISNKVVVYRLKRSVFHEYVGPDAIQELQNHTREIQRTIDVLSGVDTKTSEGTLIREYVPSTAWFWKQWTGTVLQYVWRSVFCMMIASVIFGAVVSLAIESWSYDAEHVLLDQIELIAGWWATILSLASFATIFFLSQSFSHWRDFYFCPRRIQGRFDDVNLLCAANAKEDERSGRVAAEAAQSLDDIARRGRLMHQLFLCTIVKRYGCLLTPTGFAYLRSKRVIKQDEYEGLIQSHENGIAAWITAMCWWVTTISRSVKRGDIDADQATMTIIYEKITDMRLHFGKMGVLYAGRMPLAYIHFVNLLVDVLVFVSPVALYSQYWLWSILGVGIVTLFYRGIVKLSMMLLDPVDNDEVHQSSLSGQTVGFDVGVFIREANTASIGWKGAAMVAPKHAPAKLIKKKIQTGHH
mmetsp:Transcript_25003/g.42834  ORF Transcript_25003/g.42834 Transcript_25003/m.42834 type:complete len:476 (+) Transcript_25003:631-2058(+)